MASSKITANLECSECGSQEIAVPDEPTDESVLTCAACGTELITWGRIKSAIERQARYQSVKTVQDVLAKAVKGTRNVKGL